MAPLRRQGRLVPYTQRRCLPARRCARAMRMECRARYRRSRTCARSDPRNGSSLPARCTAPQDQRPGTMTPASRSVRCRQNSRMLAAALPQNSSPKKTDDAFKTSVNARFAVGESPTSSSHTVTSTAMPQQRPKRLGTPIQRSKEMRQRGVAAHGEDAAREIEQRRPQRGAR